MMPTVNSSFLRRSGVRNALRKAESNFFLLREAGRRWSVAGRGAAVGRSARYPWLGSDSNSPVALSGQIAPGTYTGSDINRRPHGPQ